MTSKNEKAAEECNSSTAGYRNVGFNANSIKEDALDSKAYSHLELARQPHIWRKVLYRTNLPASALRVGLALVDKFVNRGKGRCFPSLATIAEECNLSVRTVRDGIEALRRSGLIVTKKRGLRDTLDFTFCMPSKAASYVTDSQHTETAPQCDGFTYSNVTDLRNRDDVNPSGNLRKEPPKKPPKKEGSGLGPAAHVVASAPPLDIPPFGSHISQPPDVEGEPRLFSDLHLDRPIERPSLYPQQRDMLIARVGKDVDLLQRFLGIWAMKPLTERLIQQLCEEDSARAAS
jgi:hypothetical protein